jgi:hypothetical protein
VGTQRGPRHDCSDGACLRLLRSAGGGRQAGRLAIEMSKISGQGFVSRLLPSLWRCPAFVSDLICPYRAGVAMRDRTDRPPAGMCPLSGGLWKDRHIWFRLGHLDRCVGSARKRIERNGLLSTSGAPSWRAEPDPETGNRKPEGRYLWQFGHLSAGQRLLASKKINPRSVEGRVARAGATGRAQVANCKQDILRWVVSPALVGAVLGPPPGSRSDWGGSEISKRDRAKCRKRGMMRPRGLCAPK